MKIIALVEVHPLSGQPSFITARFLSESGGEFDMPLSPEQAELVLQHSLSSESPAPKEAASIEEDFFEEEEEFAPSKINRPFPVDLDEDALILNAEPTTSMFTSQASYQELDDEL